MSKSNTQAQVAAEVAVANAETATIVANADVITGTIKAFNFVPAKDTKNGRAYNVIHIAVEGEDDDIIAYPYDAQLENALSLSDAVAFVDVCDVRERRKNILFRGATIEFGYDDDENVVIKSITLARASKAAALSDINLPHYLVQVGLIDRPELDVRGAYYICHQIEPDGSYYICTNREIGISYCICPYRESALRAD